MKSHFPYKKNVQEKAATLWINVGVKEEAI